VGMKTLHNTILAIAVGGTLKAEYLNTTVSSLFEWRVGYLLMICFRIYYMSG